MPVPEFIRTHPLATGANRSLLKHRKCWLSPGLRMINRSSLSTAFGRIAESGGFFSTARDEIRVLPSGANEVIKWSQKDDLALSVGYSPLIDDFLQASNLVYKTSIRIADSTIRVDELRFSSEPDRFEFLVHGPYIAYHLKWQREKSSTQVDMVQATDALYNLVHDLLDFLP